MAGITVQGMGGPGSTEVSVRLVVTFGGDVFTLEEKGTCPPDGEIGVIVSESIGATNTVVAEAKTVGPGVKIKEGTFYVNARGQWNK
jgi:hypothetical protein